MSCVNREQLRKDLLLYAVTDRSWLGNETLYEQVEKALKGGATFIQLREKELDEEHFMEEAVALKELCHKYHVPFVINDNVRIAKDMDADGVHVGQSDMEADDVRKNGGGLSWRGSRIFHFHEKRCGRCQQGNIKSNLRGSKYSSDCNWWNRGR